jgi:uncharacterized membrane protein
MITLIYRKNRSQYGFNRRDTIMKLPDKTPRERFTHALMFELIAIGLCAPTAAWLTGRGMFEMGSLTAIISLIALTWNIAFNLMFDRVRALLGWNMTLPMRVFHTVLFEIGLVLVVVPLVAWWLTMSLWQALLLDIGVILFFLPYSFFYNLIYDAWRTRRLKRSRIRPLALD